MQPEWKGSQPQRFSGGRKTFQPRNQIALGLSFSEHHAARPSGIRSFSPSVTQEAQFRPHLRIFQQSYNSVTKQIDLRGIKHVQLPQQKQRIRPQRAHVKGGDETIEEINLKGIKSFEQANRSRNKYYFVQNQLQRKGRIDGIESLRNSIGLVSLGDKAYKYPEYSVNFYHSGGLIAGSTHKLRKGEYVPQIKKGTILTKPNWDAVVKLEQLRQQKKILDSIDNWQQTTLKQNNPQWNDPDTFFDREKQKDQGKDTKKIGKK